MRSVERACDRRGKPEKCTTAGARLRRQTCESSYGRGLSTQDDVQGLPKMRLEEPAGVWLVTCHLLMAEIDGKFVMSGMK
jgi:hypothetical protein